MNKIEMNYYYKEMRKKIPAKIYHHLNNMNKVSPENWEFLLLLLTEYLEIGNPVIIERDKICNQLGIKKERFYQLLGWFQYKGLIKKEKNNNLWYITLL